MGRLTIKELGSLRLEMAKRLARRISEPESTERKATENHILVCGGTGCHASKSLEVKMALQEYLSRKGLSQKVYVIESGCNGFCARGPIMIVYPEGIFYQFMKAEDVPEFVENHIIRGEPVKRLLYKDPLSGELIPFVKDIPFFSNQQLRVLRNRGLIAAESIEEYIGRDGYQAAAKAITQMSPEQIINELKISGIRGRGGAGFPTGMKWEFARRAAGEIKYVLCNADEGDPGAFMDRSVLEADPHAVLEGMIIGARAIGSNQGYIYCRAEYPLAVKRLTIAIEQAREYGLIGENILRTGFDFDLEVYKGAGAFVCGEETALMTSIEGKRGMPRPRPPFPANQGLWNKPTILNNVETFANIPQIILKGGDWYASIGTEKSKGTKVFALTGNVNNIGLVEVPMGTPIGTIIFDIGGGIKGGKRFKAAQLGGPSGGCIPASFLNTPTDYEAITSAGAIMGSGGLIVMDEDTCMVDMARFFMDFCQDESCGKCTPCREGTKRMLQILEKITRGEGSKDDIDTLEELALFVKDASLCGLGQTAPNPVLSTLRHFRREYEAHVIDKRCPAVVCSSLFRAPCQHACPVEMDVPTYIALIREQRFDEAYNVLKETNPFPAVCGRVCTHVCQNKCRRGQLDEPMAIAVLKRSITDFGRRPKVERVPVSRKERIAVIGAGPSGLTAAQDLALRGYAVTVFEELPKPGGMLWYGIPQYRLPRDIIAAEIEDIKALGVEIRCNTRVGRDVSFEELRGSYDRIYLSIGAHKSLKLGIEGEDLEGVIGAVEFLRRFHLDQQPKIGERVAVIGGGNSAIDTSRTALRMGAREVTILYRRTRDDMPALKEEIEAAEEEGVQMRYLVTPTKIIGANGKVEGIECAQMRLGEFDRSGRKRPLPEPGKGFGLKVDTVIAAIGQSSDLSFLKGADDIRITPWETIELRSDREGATHCQGVYAGGDAVTGPQTVIQAIAAGHRAASAIDEDIRALANEPPYQPPKRPPIFIPFEIEEESEKRPQTPMPRLSLEERRRGFKEVDLGYSKEKAVEEAKRCLRCDLQID